MTSTIPNAMSLDFLPTLRRYEQLIAASLQTASSFIPSIETTDTIQVERGVVFANALTSTALNPSAVDRMLALPVNSDISRIAFIDSVGHHRPVYRPLLIYAFLQTFRIRYESIPRDEFGRWDESMRAYADLLEARLGELSLPSDAIRAPLGAIAAEAAWIALALFVAGKIFIRDAWTDLAADTFGRLTRAQRTTGAFLASNPDDNPELLWYHELAILHAAASYAVQSEDRPLAAAVARSSLLHLHETQPDHATAQPWGLFAFIWNLQANPLADELLHALRMAHPIEIDGISLMLLSDSLYCLQLFT